jgi:type IV pilus assembly protein PilB
MNMVARGGDFTAIMLRKGVISPEQLAEAQQLASEQKRQVADCLVHLGYATSEEVVQAMAKHHGMRYIDLMAINIPESVVELVPEAVARENSVLPLALEDDTLTVVLSDPFDLETIEKLRFILNRRIETALAPKEAIQAAINRHYGQMEGESADSMLQEFTDTAIDFTETTTDMVSDGEAIDETSAPVVRLVYLLIQEAVQLRASDIHIEPFENRIRVRYRIDGILIERDSPPRRLLSAITSRIKILSRLDIAERRRPQDGRIKITVGEKEMDLRVSILPTSHGQATVMRLLDKDNIKVGVRQLGLSEQNYKKFQALIRRPNGIILVTGPTGSGKTTTLYAALNHLNRPDRKIITAEDPVEYYLPGINQCEVKHGIGLDFARIIRAMMRQAPNVILVGEMRDQETASMGIQASLTGHLVFSTLHTNDAPSAITRMIDMGTPGYLVASTVIAVLAQRLVRTVCSRCRQHYTPRATELDETGIPPELAAKGSFMKGKGCNHCQRSGYRGRTGIHELMMVSPKIREMIFDAKSNADIRSVAITQGMKTLYIDGLEKALKGVTTLDEVLRVAKRTEQDAEIEILIV